MMMACMSLMMIIIIHHRKTPWRWLQEVQCRLALALDEAGPQELAQVLWALGMLRVLPHPSLTADLVAELRLKQQAMQARELVMVLHAHAR
jgi:hypothetical protein